MFSYKSSTALEAMTIEELKEELQLAYANYMHYEAADKQDWGLEEEARHEARVYSGRVYFVLKAKVTLEPRIKNLDEQLRGELAC